MEQTSFSLGLTFDDILLIPGFASFSRQDVSLKTNLTKNISLAMPFVSSPMDTVTEETLAIRLAQYGGIGIIHRNLSLSDQATQVAHVRKENLLVGAAVGASKGFEERVKALVNADVSVIVIDSAHGYTKVIMDAVSYVKKQFPSLEVIAGNIATADAAEALIASGADALRVGMGPGAICTTRIISGMGVPQVTAIMDVVKIAKKKNIPVIADGGIKYSGDMTKALALGAQTVMMGSFFAQTKEAPGESITLRKEEIPSKFAHLIKKDQERYEFKTYRGMGSVGAMEKGKDIKSEDEFHGKSYAKDKVLVAEGVEGLVPVKGSLKEVLDQAAGGIISGMYYVGAQNLSQLQEKAKFLQITQASLLESHPHDLVITNPGANY